MAAIITSSTSLSARLSFNKRAVSRLQILRPRSDYAKHNSHLTVKSCLECGDSTHRPAPGLVTKVSR
eukprot:649959-Prorocentrum_minimum.AAC.3